MHVKYCLLTALILIAAVHTGLAAESPSGTFGRNRLTVSFDSKTIGYDDFEAVALGSRWLVPARTVLIRLQPGESAADLTWSCGEWSDVGAFGETIDLTDQPTALSAERTATVDRGELPGARPVWIGPVETIGTARYLKVTIFPVSLAPDSTLRFTESITLRIRDRCLTAGDLLDPATITAPSSRDTHRHATAGTGAPAMVVVTGAPLLDAAAEFATYKTATGVTTIVSDIDDITAGYAGRDDAEKLREYLKDFAIDGGGFVLLLGDETILPVRYAYHGSTNDSVPLEDQQICDLYFADLTGEWDVDNDNVWGERFGDNADFTPELRVGRLPFSRPEQVAAYTAKLIAYQTDPGDGASGYLHRAFFFSSDEMRDYGDNGQHGLIAAAYPDSFEIDTISGVEAASGDDPVPTNQSALELTDVLDNGYGIVNILAHGRPDAFAVRTAAYNNAPKSYFTTGPLYDCHGTFDSLAPNDRIGFYYSLACDNGGFDEDRPPFVYTNPNLVEQVLALPHAGAIGFVAYSRWGWVGSSFLQQKAFFEEIFAHPELPAVDAMYAEQATYYYYRDLVLGQNYYGDPSVRIWTAPPQPLTLAVETGPDSVSAVVTSGGAPVSGCDVFVSGPSGRVETATTGADGRTALTYDFGLGVTYTVAAVTPGHVYAVATYAQSIVTDVDDDTDPDLPRTFALNQNYPNPFNPTTTIGFALPRTSQVTLDIYNINGRLVSRLIDRILPAGAHEVQWGGTDRHGNKVASGVYFYRIATESAVATKRMVLLK